MVTFTVKSSTVGLETFTATSESVTVTQTASVDFQTVPSGGRRHLHGGGLADHGSRRWHDDFHHHRHPQGRLRTSVASEGVTLAKTSGPGTPVISPAGVQITNASGVATFTVRSSTAGTEVFTATSVTASVVVTQTASVTFTPVGPTQLVLLLDPPVARQHQCDWRHLGESL